MRSYLSNVGMCISIKKSNFYCFDQNASKNTIVWQTNTYSMDNTSTFNEHK